MTSITIPDSVTSIGYSAFSGCSGLESITIPFVGAEAGKTASDTYQYPFGCIFGTTSYTGGTGVTQRYLKQYYSGNDTWSSADATYYIPSSLREVTVTGGNILYGAFWGCNGLTSVTIGAGVTSIGSHAFYNCTRLTSVTFEETSGWFVSTSSSATRGTNISAGSLSDKSIAASYLKSMYYNYYWKRNA